LNEVGDIGSRPTPAAFASQDEALRNFEELQPVMPDEMIGLWEGHGIASGHPLDGVLENLGWYGKRSARICAPMRFCSGPDASGSWPSIRYGSRSGWRSVEPLRPYPDRKELVHLP
jgi:hypothetical protein